MDHARTYVGLLALSLAPVLHAEVSLELTSLGDGRGSTQQVQVRGELLWDDPTEYDYNGLGCHEKLWSDASGAGVITHCIEIHASIPDGVSNFDVVDLADAPGGGWPGPMGALRAELLEGLFAEWIDPLTGGVTGGAGQEARATAFQLMTWEITHESFEASTTNEMADQLDFTLGAIKWRSRGDDFDTAVESYATEMIDLLRLGNLGSGPVAGLVSESGQDQAMYVPGPGAGALLAAALGVGRRRRRG